MNRTKTILTSLLMLAMSLQLIAGEIYVDRKGVMREKGTKKEVSYYGVNYTVPFAHAYRALGELGIDRKEAIDRDVYHFARLGFNAFRIHIWDVEISDGVGNLLENEHLDLLDYLIAKVEERGISVILTAQTNFGNGYPENNMDTGAFSYIYGKGRVHDNPDGIAAQERYIRQLVSHKNPYNGKKYCDDDLIIAMEINNEPSHSGNAKDAENYINRMVKSMKSGGWDKVVLYNVSHNGHCVEGFYNANIQGTTYQWYPMGLVKNSTRYGNYLPAADQYEIPFENLKNFSKMSKVVYEFDPADNLYSHLYPAIARTFRKEGFQWITQFAYDPIDMAWANTEYQTHYLNLAYTPRKALSMKIAAEVTHEVPLYTDFGKYPADTLFGDFTVSYRRDLSQYNSGKKYFHSNNTDSQPKNIAELEEVAGWGTSPVISYEGTGAYFLDKIKDGVWRLEVMPDVIMITDPFTTPSLKRRTSEIVYADNDICINIPQLGKTYSYKAVNKGNSLSGTASDGGFVVRPGVYLLSADGSYAGVDAADDLGYVKIGEYVAPEAYKVPFTMLHKPALAAEKGKNLKIKATVIGEPDSLMVYSRSFSMRRGAGPRSPFVKMVHKDGYEYEAEVNTGMGGNYSYNIVAFFGDRAVTWPDARDGKPTDWDFAPSEMYETALYSVEEPLVLLEPKPGLDGSELAAIPDRRMGAVYRFIRNSPMDADLLQLSAKPNQNVSLLLIKRVADVVGGRNGLDDGRKLCVYANLSGEAEVLEVSVTNRDGITFTAPVTKVDGVVKLDRSAFRIAPTALCPTPYPGFLGRYFYPDENLEAELHWNEVEELKLVLPDLQAGKSAVLDIRGVWLE